MKETVKNSKFKIDLKSIPWETNILSQVILSASSAFDLFFKQINTLLDEHAPVSLRNHFRRNLGSAEGFNHL